MYKKKILITGGLGYIGSVLAVNLIKKYSVFILDKSSKNRFIKSKNIKIFKINLKNFKKSYKIIKKISPDIIVHLAAQSTIDMVKNKKKSYLINNLNVTENIVNISKLLKVKKFIFSSTAAVYKQKNKSLSEKDVLRPNNLYGLTKLKNEIFIKSSFINTQTKFCILRFFNVCGADKKNLIGEYHIPETHLLPIIINNALKKRTIYIYGNNYLTKDGTCIRDYVHVKDIVSGIIKSIDYLKNNNSAIFNLGTEKGLTVLELINFCKKKLKSNIFLKIKNRRFGDMEKLVCKFDKAKKFLKWIPKYSSVGKIVNDEIWWCHHLSSKNYHRNFIY